MSAATTRTALVDGEEVSVVAIVNYLKSLWGLSDLRDVFEKSCRMYHHSAALRDARKSGVIDRHIEIYNQDGELPEYVVGMYFHARPKPEIS